MARKWSQDRSRVQTQTRNIQTTALTHATMEIQDDMCETKEDNINFLKIMKKKSCNSLKETFSRSFYPSWDNEDTRIRLIADPYFELHLNIHSILQAVVAEGFACEDANTLVPVRLPRASLFEKVSNNVVTFSQMAIKHWTSMTKLCGPVVSTRVS